MHAIRGRPEAAERHGAGHVARCTARAPHGRPGPTRRQTRQVPVHHAQCAARAVPGRPGQAPLRGVCPGWAVGRRHSPASGRCPLLCTRLLRVGLCGFRDRRLLAEDHRLADLHEPVHRPGPGRPSDGRLAAETSGGRPDGPGASLRPWGAVPVHSLRGCPVRVRGGRLGGVEGRLLLALLWPRL